MNLRLISASASCVQTNGGSQRTCQCNSGTAFVGSSCMTSSYNCPYNTVYISDSNCMQLVALGQSCVYTSQCMGFSACTGGRCQCPYSYTNTNGVCRPQNALVKSHLNLPQNLKKKKEKQNLVIKSQHAQNLIAKKWLVKSVTEMI